MKIAYQSFARPILTNQLVAAGRVHNSSAGRHCPTANPKRQRAVRTARLTFGDAQTGGNIQKALVRTEFRLFHDGAKLSISHWAKGPTPFPSKKIFWKTCGIACCISRGICHLRWDRLALKWHKVSQVQIFSQTKSAELVAKNKVYFPSVSLSLDLCRVTLVAPWTAASTASGLFTVWPALCPPLAAMPTRSPPSSPARLPTSAGWTTWVWGTPHSLLQSSEYFSVWKYGLL